MCGDGGLAMTMNELETAVRLGAKPVVIVFDNERYGTIAMHQANERREPVATGLGRSISRQLPARVARRASTCASNSEFEPALRAALAADRATVLHLDLDPGWISPDRPPPAV